ncbi:MAG: putative cytokinin oxidase [Labilithrix sp.]|nr:putative cytokinin oxidase [Labilithrix sp.]
MAVARRRFLQGAAAVAVIGFDPARRSWVTEARAGRNLSRLPRLDGELVTDATSLAEAADDYGHFIHRTPRAVLRPGSIRDVVEMVRYAKEHRLDIAMRGQGHSTHGQSQVDAGIVIDSRTMNQIHEVKPGYAVVGPGARWREIVAATLPLGLTPPTIPNYLDLTIGGNIAVGGIGGAAHRHGSVIDNVLELEVVTGTGHLRRCSATDNAALFNAVLGGLGQFGIVVRARIRLLPAKQLARMYTLQYPDVASFRQDVRIATLDERFDHIEAQINSDPVTGKYGTVTMFAASYFNPGDPPPDDVALLEGLEPTGATVDDLPYNVFLERIDPIVEFLKSVGAWALPHPWFDVFLPESTIEQFLAETLAPLTTADTGNANVLLYPLRRSKFKRPLLRVPESDEVLFLYDLLAFAPPVPEVVAQMVARNTGWQDRAVQLGGKRYNIGSANLTREDWKRYFSPLWPAAVLAKLAYDPANILTPGQGIFPASGCDD